MSKALSRETKVLDAVHDRYFIGYYNLGETAPEKGELANAAQSELQERYATYYEAWAEDEKHLRETSQAGLLTTFEMLQRFFPRYKPVLDCTLALSLQTHICLFIERLLEFRNEFAIDRS